MYTNIGEKIKSVAIILAVVGITASIIVGIMSISQGSRYSGSTMISGWVYIIVGPILSWVLSLALYGFGELIVRTQKIHQVLMAQNGEWNEVKGENNENHEKEPVFYKTQNGRKTWKCPACGHVNDFKRLSCEKCGKR